jgi:AbrB family looped-hinge helix DNA binding protein
MVKPIKVGKRGTVVLPAKIRRRSGIKEGTILIAEESPYGILIRPAAFLPIEIYTPGTRRTAAHGSRPERSPQEAEEATAGENPPSNLKKLGVIPDVLVILRQNETPAGRECEIRKDGR